MKNFRTSRNPLLAGGLASAVGRLLPGRRIMGFLVAASTFCVLVGSSVCAQQPLHKQPEVFILPAPLEEVGEIFHRGPQEMFFLPFPQELEAVGEMFDRPRVSRRTRPRPFKDVSEGALKPPLVTTSVSGIQPAAFSDLHPSPVAGRIRLTGSDEAVTESILFPQSPRRASETPEGIVTKEPSPFPESLSRVFDAPEEPDETVARDLERLKERLKEFETTQAAHEDATRIIIKNSYAERGANITEFVLFGGTLESVAARTRDFDGTTLTKTELSTAQFDFEIQVTSWALGSMIFEYVDGTNVLFPTNATDFAGVDRITVDTAYIRIGDSERHPLFATFGRNIVPFGISTGNPVADVLNIESPLTLEVFETKEDILMIGAEFPTPPPRPTLPTIPTIPPPIVRPLLFKPLVRALAGSLWSYGGYPSPPKTPPKATPAPTHPPFQVAAYFYNGNTHATPFVPGGGNDIEHFGTTAGYRTKGCFPYQVPILSPCPETPWSLDFDVDFISSVFDSRFLGFEYRLFQDQIGNVPGMAAHVKSTLGPVSLVAEWNGAIDDAVFTDDLGTDINITPSAWQIALAYQFDWNPSIQVIGDQGTYITICYSESQDLAGVTQGMGIDAQRVGFVPRRRFLVSVGEWVLDGVRFAVEYSHIVDYSVAKGGTGRSGNGVLAQLTYSW